MTTFVSCGTQGTHWSLLAGASIFSIGLLQLFYWWRTKEVSVGLRLWGTGLGSGGRVCHCPHCILSPILLSSALFHCSIFPHHPVQKSVNASWWKTYRWSLSGQSLVTCIFWLWGPTPIIKPTNTQLSTSIAVLASTQKCLIALLL